jgi:hydroxyethylthiazole kinase-like uncharacterized protein yjeF
MPRSLRAELAASGGHDGVPGRPALLDRALLESWPLPADDHGDKFARGTVLVVGGSPVTPGAVILAGMAVLRMGAGRLQIATAAPVAPAVAVAVPEALVMPIPVDDDGALRHPFDEELLERIGAADALLIGPGMRSEPSPVDVLEVMLRRASDASVVVLDAAALSCLPHVSAPVRAQHRGRLLLTPNRQEARCLDEVDGVQCDGDDPSTDCDSVITRVAHRYGAVVTSFGTVRCADGRGWDGPPGHPSLGTSGSGDVLAGLAAGAAGRTRDAAQAACWATYVHAATGARLGVDRGALGFLARELVEHARV